MPYFYADSEEKYVKGVVLFHKAADGILYKNLNSGTYSDAVSAAELGELFAKGLLVVNDGTNLVRPTSYTENKTGTVVNYSYVAYTTVGTSDKAVATAFYSAGYSAT